MNTVVSVASVASAAAVAAPSFACEPSGSDAALVALADAVEHHVKELERVSAELTAAGERYEAAAPDWPDALLVRSGDINVLGLSIVGVTCGDRKRRHLRVDDLRSNGPQGYSIENDDGTVEFVPSERAQRRADEVLVAHDEWSAACDRACQDTGLASAEQAADEAYNRYATAVEQVLTMPASTTEGLAAKARVFWAVWKRNHDERDRHAILECCDEPPERVAISAMLDFVSGVATARLGTHVPLPVIAHCDAADADPIFAAIEEHRAAFFEYFEVITNVPSIDDDLICEGLEYEAAFDRTEDASVALVNIQPTTIEGVLALLTYVHEFNTGTIKSARRQSVYSGDNLWPEYLTDDEAKDPRGRALDLPFPYWIMENVRAALTEMSAVRS